jgi:GNAT superfamily N-acetyltransferase
VDQKDHVAWGMLSVEGVGIGVGRYILAPGATCAEVALTVLDSWQGRGVGTLLLRVLVAVARADGLEELCFKYLPENTQVERMLEGIPARFDALESLMEARMSLHSVPPAEWDDDALAVLGEVRI